MSDEFLRRISESIRARGERPSNVQYEEMIARGVIDRDGNVTIRRPEAPCPSHEARTGQDADDHPGR